MPSPLGESLCHLVRLDVKTHHEYPDDTNERMNTYFQPFLVEMNGARKIAQ